MIDLIGIITGAHMAWRAIRNSSAGYGGRILSGLFGFLFSAVCAYHFYLFSDASLGVPYSPGYDIFFFKPIVFGGIVLFVFGMACLIDGIVIQTFTNTRRVFMIVVGVLFILPTFVHLFMVAPVAWKEARYYKLLQSDDFVSRYKTE